MARHYWELEHVELRQSADEAKLDLELTCAVCERVLCDAEAGDTVDTLARIVRDPKAHKPGCKSLEQEES